MINEEKKAIALARKTARFQRMIDDMPTKTLHQRNRKATAQKKLESVSDDGRFGKITELLTAEKNSKKEYVAKPNRADVFLHLHGEGVKTVAVEVKTNGGRVGNIIKNLAAGNDGYVIYSMDICNSGTNYLERKTEQKLFKYSEFIELLMECNALKIAKHADKDDAEYAIQASSKQLWLAVSEWERTYKPGMVYDL